MSAPTTILVVEDNQISREVLQTRLAERGYRVLTAVSAEDALRLLRTEAPELVLLDIILPGIDGLELLREIRKSRTATELPVVMLTIREGSEDVVEALRLGANDYVTKTVDFTVILARVETQLSLRKLMIKVHELAARDSLTGLYNRRGFFELAEREEARARRYDMPLHALLLDIDHFKSINDTHGHKVGDNVLIETARRLRLGVRSSDLLGRWGGEEFVALLPGVTREGARQTGERLRGAIGDKPFETSAGPVPTSISVGVASFDDSCANLGDMMNHVDQALYDAKHAGRNRVRVYREGDVEPASDGPPSAVRA